MYRIFTILKDTPEKIPERVPRYIERILDDERNGFKFSEEQKKIRQRSYEENTEIKTFLNEMNSKYYNYSE